MNYIIKYIDMNITGKQLEVFSKISEQKSVSRAAKKLFMTQSAASMALSELEKSLGEKLFERNGRKLILNEKGKFLLPKANEVIERIEEIEGCFKGDLEKPISLSMGASTTIGNYFLPGLLGRFSNETGLKSQVLEIGNTQKILDKVSSYEIDFGFVEGYELRDDIDFLPWRKDRLVIVASPKHPLAQKEKITAKDLSRERWIMREKGSGSRSVFEKAIDGKLVNLEVSLELGNTEAIKGAVLSGAGIGCVSLVSVKKKLWNQELVALRAPFLNLHRDWFIAINRKKYKSHVLRGALDYWRKFSLRS